MKFLKHFSIVTHLAKIIIVILVYFLKFNFEIIMVSSEVANRTEKCPVSFTQLPPKVTPIDSTLLKAENVYWRNTVN